MTAKAEQGTGQLRSTYEDFANRPFYVDINRQTVALLPQVRNVVDIATGTGAIITQLIQQEKLLPDYQIKGYDIDKTSLEEARKKFGRFNSQIKFENASAEFIPLGDDWADAVTFCNAIDLTNVQRAMDEASRILKPGRPMVVNTAYAKDMAYPRNSRRLWGLWVLKAREIAESEYKLIPDEPVNLLKHTSEDYKQMALNAGFEKVFLGQIVKEMDEEDLTAIGGYKEFTEGAMPGIPYEISKDCLIRAIKPTLERAPTGKLPRGWMVMFAFKKAA